MVKKILVLAFLLGSTTAPVCAAAYRTAPPDSLPPYRWNVGVDLLNLLRSGTTNALLWKQVKSNQAWRFSVSADYTRWGFNNPQNTLVTHQYSVLIRPGYEWQYPAKRHMLYQGVDVGVGYSGLTQNANKLQVQIVSGQIGTTALFVASSYFAGFRYRLFDRCSVWVEAAFQANYKRTYYRVGAPQLPTRGEPNQLDLNFIPLRHAGLSYHF